MCGKADSQSDPGFKEASRSVCLFNSAHDLNPPVYIKAFKAVIRWRGSKVILG